jgi:hypothetical protein
MIPTVLKFIVHLSEHNKELLKQYSDDVSVYLRELLENCASLNSDSFNIIDVFRKLNAVKVVNVKQALMEHFTENEDYDLFKRIIDDIKKPEDFDYVYDMVSKLSISKVIGEGKTLQGEVFIFNFLNYIAENLNMFENKSDTILYVMDKYKKEVKLSYKYNSLAVDRLFKTFSDSYTVNFNALKQDKFYEFIKECLGFASEEIKIDFLATMLEYISAFERYFKITMENLDMPKLIKNIKKIRVFDDDLEEAETFLVKLSEEFTGCVLAGDVQVNVLKFVKEYNLYKLIADEYLKNLKESEHTIYFFTLNENSEENKRRLIDLHDLFSSHDPEFKNKLYSMEIRTDYYSFSEMIIDLMDSKVNLKKFRIAAEYLNHDKNKKIKEKFTEACLHALTGFSSKTKKEKIVNLIKNLMLLFYNSMKLSNVIKDRSFERIFCLIKKQELLDIFKEISYSNYDEKTINHIYI